MATLRMDAITKVFGAEEVVKGIDLQIGDGEFVVFVGPSGCGKSTLLRMIAGLEDITDGELFIDGEYSNDILPKDRGIAMVFQSYALYPHKSVYGNMAFGLRLAGKRRREVDARIREAAQILRMEHLLDRRPGQLSGGQRQRVAIGRAIVRNPKVFLFDEPLSNLDAALRVSMRRELAKLHGELGATMIYVTHDQIEAMTMADRIVVLDQGVAQQVGSPLDLYNYPRNLFVAGFIGSPRMNFLEGRVGVNGESGTRLVCADTSEDVVVTGIGPEFAAGSTRITIGVRPEHLKVCGDETPRIRGTVQLTEQLGDQSLVEATTRSGKTLVAKTEPGVSMAPDDDIGFTFDAGDLHLFDDNGDAFTKPLAADAGSGLGKV